ncbi:MAG: hypothetical protein JJT94_06740 [Bernardetiaceae bacterium]|nr:hypothetical protein [Bernardetiaceae bacterium]
MRYFSVIYIFLFVLSSCSPIISTVLGIKNPVKLTEKEVSTYAIQEKIQPFYVADSVILKKLAYKNNYGIGSFQPIQFKFFDKKGQALARYVSCEGSTKRWETFERFPPRSLEHDLTRYNLYEELPYYRDLEGNTPIIEEDTEYIFIVYWATFTGKPGRNLIEKVKRYLNLHQNKHIQIIFVNVFEL